MPLMTRKTFKELAEVGRRPCISIYIPTDRVGDNKKAQIRFKNHIQMGRGCLQDQGMSERQISEFTRPLEMLQNDPEIWRHLSDGLAVFLSPGKFAYSTFPIRFKEYAEVNTHFYLLPLMPVFNGDGRFFILALSLGQVRLFEGTRDHVMEIGIDDLVPQTIYDTIGHDYEQRSLQFRSGQTGGGEGLFHGQGRGKDYRKEEIVKHLREINRSLAGFLQGYESPMVVASVDYIFALYRTVNTYAHLFPKNISGSPDEEKMQDMHQRAWSLLKDHFLKHRHKTLKDYHFLSSKGRTTSVMADIVYALQEGRIDTLFIQKDQHLWGVVDKASNGVHIQDEKTAENHCLLDRVAKSAFLQGARVYLMEGEEMPENGSVIAATLRF